MRRLCVLLTSLMLLAAGCGGDDASPAEEAVRAVGAGDAILLDVRTDREFAAGHAEGTKHFPHEDMVRGGRPKLAKDTTIYVYCRSGRRAAEAVTILRRDGYTDVVSIGGLRDWQAAGGDVT